MRRLAAVLAGALLVTTACSGGDDERVVPSTAAATTTTVALHEVVSSELTVVEEGRDRTLRTIVHRPEGAAGPFPLVVFGHGLGGRPEQFADLLTEIAGHGYVVAVPEFPVTRSGLRDDAVDVNNQPADVSAVIDHVTGELSGVVDGDRVAVAGHSLGAVTALLTGYHPCCRDERVDAVVALAGGPLFGTGRGRYFDVGDGTPLLLLHGDEDQLLRYPLGRSAYEMAAAPKYLVTLLGADHVAAFVYQDPWYEVVRETTLDFLAGILDDDGAALDRLRSDAEVEGVSRLESVSSG